MKNLSRKFTLILIISLIVISCKKETYIPKPRSFFRVDFPAKKYQKFEGTCNFTYNYPIYSRIIDRSNNCNQVLTFPRLKASIYFTYKEITKEENYMHFESARQLAYEHRIKAQSIDETVISNDSNNVYGMIYEINGNVASNIQFFLTDSVKNFYRGALYFETRPNYDSLIPSIEFVKKDILELCNSFQFKD